MANTSKRLSRRISLVAGTLFVSVAAVGALTAASRPLIYSIEAEHLVPEVARAQTTGDSLPDPLQVIAAEGEIRLDSVRLIAQSEFGSHWTAQSARDEICLMTIVADASVWTASCTPRPQFYSHGASQALGSASFPGVEVHLIPDGIPESTVRDAVRASAEVRAGATAQAVEIGDEVDFQLLGDSRVLVLSVREAAKIGDVRVPRNGQKDLVIYAMGSSE